MLRFWFKTRFKPLSSSFLACNSRLRSAIHRHHPPQRAKSAASGSIRWCCFRSCWTVLSHVMRGRPSCLFQSARGEANRILLASAMRIICPNKVSRHDWIIAVSLGCFVSLHTSSFRTNWYHLMPSSIRRHQRRLEDRELNQATSKPDTVNRPVRTARIFVHHYNSTHSLTHCCA